MHIKGPGSRGKNDKKIPLEYIHRYRNGGLSITGGNTQPKVLHSEKGEKEALKPSLSTPGSSPKI